MRTKLKLTICVAIVLSAATVLYLAKTMAAQGMVQTITVTITPKPTGEPSVNAGHAKHTRKQRRIRPKPTGQPSVHPDTVDLYRAREQQVVWTCSTGCNFEVTFPPTGTPFKGYSFNNANPKSGVPVARAGRYQYTVKVKQNPGHGTIIVH